MSVTLKILQAPKPGDRVIVRAHPSLPARVVKEVSETGYVRLVDGGAGSSNRFMVVPCDWADAPPVYFSEVTAHYFGASGTLESAEARDASLPYLAKRLDAAEDYLQWVLTHPRRLSPQEFEPLACEAWRSREYALRLYTAAKEVADVVPAQQEAA